MQTITRPIKNLKRGVRVRKLSLITRKCYKPKSIVVITALAFFFFSLHCSGTDTSTISDYKYVPYVLVLLCQDTQILHNLQQSLWLSSSHNMHGNSFETGFLLIQNVPERHLKHQIWSSCSVFLYWFKYRAPIWGWDMLVECEQWFFFLKNLQRTAFNLIMLCLSVNNLPILEGEMEGSEKQTGAFKGVSIL